jgi:hypothetical protein
MPYDISISDVEYDQIVRSPDKNRSLSIIKSKLRAARASADQSRPTASRGRRGADGVVTTSSPTAANTSPSRCGCGDPHDGTYSHHYDGRPCSSADRIDG